MKKHGKYEKTPDIQPAVRKKPEARSMLLQTYFVSLISLLLCVCMFFGTSFAWFTSEVNNAENEIYVGVLKVGLYKESEDGLKDLAVGDTKLFDGEIRWEPGYTAIETIQVVNKGDLAFQYAMTFTDGTLLNPEGVSLADVAEYFDVWVFDHLNKTYAAPQNYDAIVNSSDWVNVGTLADVLDGEIVLSGKMVTVRQEGQSQAAVNSGTTDGVATVDKFTIALHMKDNATEAVMGKRISLNVRLVAYQMTSEKDAFGNDTYDDNLITASDAEELKAVLASSKDVILVSDIALKHADECVTMKEVVLDGNGKTLTYSGDKKGGSSVGVLTTSGGKVSNLKIDGKDNGRALYVTKLVSDLVVTDCTLSGAYSFNLNSAVKADHAIVSFIDTKFTSWVSYANVANHVYFTDCEFGYVLKPYGDTTLTDCTFAQDKLDLSKLEAGESVTLVNCTYKGRLIEKAVLTSDGTTVTVTGTDLLKVNSDHTVILNG